MAKGESYEKFVNKFRPKKTTDDCYTPPIVYDAVADWVANEYHLDQLSFVRPFWPGGNYECFDYPADSVVVDNPPFSIISKIVRHYLCEGIRFFMFAPTLTLFGAHERGACYIPCGVSITYENGAVVNTSFVTNLDPCQLRTAPTLYKTVMAANDEQHRKNVRKLPVYQYPPHVLTAAAAYEFSKHGVDFRVKPSECCFIRTLDAMRERKKSGIFGSALLLSDRAAAERAAAEHAAAEHAAAESTAAIQWQLSPREQKIVHTLGEYLEENAQ